jgi:hypothetical protein
VTTVSVKSDPRQRSSQSPAPGPAPPELASVAPIATTEGAASASVVSGIARSAAAMPSATNGSAGIRNRGP